MCNPIFSSALADRLSDYVSLRAVEGVNPQRQIKRLRYFDRFLCHEQFKGQWLNRDLIQRYAASMKQLHVRTRQTRFSVVRQFCRYLQQFEPLCFVPEHLLFKLRNHSRLPFIFKETEIEALLATAKTLSPQHPFRSHTYSVLFGLLYTTGLRVGEAIALNLGDISLDRQVLYVRKGKFHKARWVPLSPSACSAVEAYVEDRVRTYPTTSDAPLFVNLRNNRLWHQDIDRALRKILLHCGLRGGKGCPGPRIHDLRHTFAVHRIVEWYRKGKEVNALLPVLATYMGHVNVSSTQVYLQATTELLSEANKRFVKNFRDNILKKRGDS